MNGQFLLKVRHLVSRWWWWISPQNGAVTSWDLETGNLMVKFILLSIKMWRGEDTAKPQIWLSQSLMFYSVKKHLNSLFIEAISSFQEHTATVKIPSPPPLLLDSAHPISFSYFFISFLPHIKSCRGSVAPRCFDRFPIEAFPLNTATDRRSTRVKASLTIL